jgi:hypothetical protein
MPIVLTSAARPNRKEVNAVAAGGATSVQILGNDGNGYASVAAMQAAGVTPWPSLSLGSGDCILKTKGLAAGGVTPGSPYLIWINGIKAGNVLPTTGGDEIAGSDYTQIDGPGYINTICFQLTAGTDTPEFLVSW